MRNCRKALLWEFVIGQSILRLGPILYFYVYKHKVVLLKVDWRTSFVFVAWVWVQICILASQEIFGPRTFVPAYLVPPAYDYHPILHEDEESTRVILGSSSLSSPSRDSKSETPRTTAAESKDSKFKRLFDCAICMQHVEVPVIPGTSPGDSGVASASAGGGSAFLWRRNYMITPCRHVFHTKCLEAAMRYRLQCPICREGLPPL